ncbi:protein translocase subunit SecF [Psychrobium sp. 1_MG-2023]|uniref:protein translocase subunit SecF n=1 Tax=Psychrobium sp. 1_MG-2023 TaxID=3062624 RepID=UPI000C337790|nr:protein translocase subunit SecF [Psychrobium sp. 1_MG-2023]MDP2559806.1 protein translocase subunit SecF [Psychrobium sp. 1_MG-2023]PKF59088.1 protein translocase subunit SecF [Alteromonadales bacterium alter-6D02]
MFKIFKSESAINFMGLRKLAIVFSVIMMSLSVFSVFTNKLNLGLDFTGGTVIEVGFAQDADLQKVREVLAVNGFDDAVVQNFGSPRDVLVRLAPRDDVKAETIGSQVLDTLNEQLGQQVSMRRIEFVGPKVGDELTEKGGLAMLAALICILIYVAMRFEWRFALGAVIALAHDVFITIGLFSFLQLEFDLTVLAAILAVIGYSLNDTIVVSDRIRENFRKLRTGTPSEVINISLTQTMSRTLITSLTTIIVLLALFFKGGALIHGFATALLFGVFIGTYSSVYVASSVALSLGITKEDLMPVEVEKEGEEHDDMMP